MSTKNEKIAGLIQKNVSEIIQFSLKDPKIGFITITDAKVTNDLSYCSVYISSMYGMEKSKEAAKALKNAAGYIRKELGHRLKLRHVPAPLFYATDSIEYSANINKLLLDLDIPEEDETDETDE